MELKEEVGNGLNRRNFLSAMAMATAVLALGFASNNSVAEFCFPWTGENRRRVGVSEAAFRRARKRAQALVKRMPFSAQAFWYWDEGARQFVLQPGTAKILAGNSSAELLLAGELTLKTVGKEIRAEPEALTSVAVKSRVL